MIMSDKNLREHLLEFIPGRSAHIDIESALDGFPVDRMNERVGGSPHSAWDLLEHIRIAQWDILEFSRDAKHVSPAWPEGYWPSSPGSAEDWHRSARHVIDDLEAVRKLASESDLFSRIEHGDGQTILREILLVADHNAYHLGQLMLVRRMLEATQ
jgi:hypothetical protein